MSRLFGVISVVSMVSMSCGVGCNVCARFLNAEDRIYDGSGECDASGRRTMKSTTSVSACEAIYVQCSAADRQAISSFVRCYESVPACRDGNEGAAITAMVKCSSDAATVSASCAAAFK